MITEDGTSTITAVKAGDLTSVADHGARIGASHVHGVVTIRVGDDGLSAQFPDAKLGTLRDVLTRLQNELATPG